jgi:hypothetical protein
MLENRQFASIVEWAQEETGLTRALLTCLYDSEREICYRAAQALGMVCKVEAARNMPMARRIIRHLFWTMNDESGSICWYAPEAIGEILVRIPELSAEHTMLLSSFIREEPFERGVHRALARIASEFPEHARDAADALAESLDDPDPLIRGYAIITLGHLGATIPLEKTEQMRRDQSSFELYNSETGQFERTSVAQAANRILRHEL